MKQTQIIRRRPRRRYETEPDYGYCDPVIRRARRARERDARKTAEGR